MYWRPIIPPGLYNPTGSSAPNPFGAFRSTETQENITTYNGVTFNVTDHSVDTSIDPLDNSKVVLAIPSHYNINFSCQLDKTDSGSDDVTIWIRQGGVNVANSAAQITLPTNNAKLIFDWHFFIETTDPNDYFQLIWYSSDVNMRMLYQSSISSPIVRPAISSAILTVVAV